MVNDEHYVYLKGEEEDKKFLLMEKGLPIVLPTREHIKNIYRKKEDGTLEIGRVLFNPLDEDVIKGDSVSISRLKHTIELMYGHIFAATGESLLKLAADVELQSNTTMELNKFLGSLTQAGGIGIKQVVDETTINNWVKIYTELKTTLFNIYLAKKDKAKKVTYNRLASIRSDLYDQLTAKDKPTSIAGVKLRNKDIKVFKLLIEYMLGEEFDLDIKTLSVGSNDKESPAFIALMSLYYKLISRTNKILKGLKHVDVEVVDRYTITELIPIEELTDLSSYATELKSIPSEIDIYRGLMSKEPQQDNTIQPISTSPLAIEPIATPATPKPNSLAAALEAERSRTGIVTHVIPNPIQQPMGIPVQPVQQPMFDPGYYYGQPNPYGYNR